MRYYSRYFRHSLSVLGTLLAFAAAGCGTQISPLAIKAKIPHHQVNLPTSANVERWYRQWDKKTFIAGISEDPEVSAAESMQDAKKAVARSLMNLTGAHRLRPNLELNEVVANLANLIQPEQLILLDDAVFSENQLSGSNQPVTGSARERRLSVYFLKTSDVRSALRYLVDAGALQAGFLLQNLEQLAGVKILMDGLSQTLPVEWVEPNLVGFLPLTKGKAARENGVEGGLGLAPEFKFNTSIVSVLKRMRADSAFSYVERVRQSLPSVTVAILDTGVDSSHPELKDHMFVNPAEKFDGADNDNNCFIDDVHGIDATFECGRDTGPDPKPGHADLGGAGKSCPRIRPDDELSANCGHGSHVAGLVAAKHGGDLSTMGICPSCRILSVRVAERCQQPETSQAEECVRPSGSIDPLRSYEVDGGIADTSQIRALTYLYNLRAPGDRGRLLVNIVNLSLGKYFASRTMSYIIRNLQRKNIVVVAAAGNDGTETPSYPAAYESVVAVCATSEDYAQGAYGRAPFSNFGDWVDICAPGTDIVSTVPGKTSDGGGLFIDKSGTSQATPFVAGAIGYLLSFSGNTKSAVELVETLKNAADSESLYNSANNRVPGTDERLYRACYTDTSFCDNLLGAGFLDLDAAVQYRKQSKTNFNFLSNQPGGCIVGSAAFVAASGGQFVNGFASMPAMLVFFWLALRLAGAMQRHSRKSDR
jgi:subtilisin family serine protease